MTTAESVVLDASAFVRFHTGSSAAVEILRDAWMARSEILAPDLILAEVANSLLRYSRRGEISTADAREALDDLQRAVSVVPLAMLFPAAFDIAVDRDLTPYDAAYVELSEALDVPLITADRKLAASTPNAVLVD